MVDIDVRVDQVLENVVERGTGMRPGLVELRLWVDEFRENGRPAKVDVESPCDEIMGEEMLMVLSVGMGTTVDELLVPLLAPEGSERLSVFGFGVNGTDGRGTTVEAWAEEILMLPTVDE